MPTSVTPSRRPPTGVRRGWSVSLSSSPPNGATSLQLATAALVAHNRSPFSVGIGATLALWAVTIVAATSGSAIARIVSQRQLNRAGAVLFAGIGLFILYTTLR